MKATDSDKKNVVPIVGSVNRITVTEQIYKHHLWHEGPMGPNSQFCINLRPTYMDS